jgi:radical SAM-linked protein
MSFAAPLGVGLTSKGEYFDIEINSTADLRSKQSEIVGNNMISEQEITDIHKRLAEQMVEGIEIITVSSLPAGALNAMASVAAAAYTICFTNKIAPLIDLSSQFDAFLQSPAIIYNKSTKKGARQIDLRPLIYKAAYNPDNQSIYLLVNASSADSIKPQFVIEAFFDYIGQRLPEFALAICREEIYTNAGTAADPQFISLGEVH